MCEFDFQCASLTLEIRVQLNTRHGVEAVFQNQKQVFSIVIIQTLNFPASGFIRFPGLSELRNMTVDVWHSRCLVSSHPGIQSIRNGVSLCHLPSNRRPV